MSRKRPTMSKTFRTLDDVDVERQARACCASDLNVPMENGRVTDCHPARNVSQPTHHRDFPTKAAR